MANTPTFVAKKVGDEYILVPKDSATQRPIWSLAGGLLLVLGLTRRSKVTPLLMIGGAAMVYRGVTGLSPWYRFFCSKAFHDAEGAPDVGPSYARLAPGVRQSPADDLDEALMESFPASDPPAVSHSTGDEDTLKASGD